MRDIDQSGVIYFGAVYGWHEALFTSWMAGIGAPLSRLLPLGRATATVASRAEYLRPLRMDDVVQLELRATTPGRTSLGYRTSGTKVGESDVAVVVESRHVWTELGPLMADGSRSLEAREIPAWLRAALDGQSVDVDLG